MIHFQSQENAPAVSSQQLIKDRNMMALFNLVRKNAPVSRASLARISGLSPATVSMLIDELIANQWIMETDLIPETTERGRKPILLEVNAARGLIATLEILSRGYVLTIYDIRLNRIASRRVREASATCAGVLDAISSIAGENRLDVGRLLGVHVLFPGLFEEGTGRLGFSAVIPEACMAEPDLIAGLRAGLPNARVMISNNSTVTAYAAYMDAGENTRTPLLAMTIYEGINAGIVMRAGGRDICLPVEAGHIIVREDGPLCKCGNRGCLETLCSTPALFRAVSENTGRPLRYSDTYGADCNQDAMEQVSEAFFAGDPGAEAALRGFTRSLCCGLISIVNLFGVRSIRIGGAIRALGNGFSSLLRETLKNEYSTVTSSRELNVELFDDDCESSRNAAAILIMESIFRGV